MKQQTAVQYLIEQLKSGELKFKITKKSLIISTGAGINHIEIAKQMEKKQIEVAFSDGQKIPLNSQTLPMYSREEYYNDTYNG